MKTKRRSMKINQQGNLDINDFKVTHINSKTELTETLPLIFPNKMYNEELLKISEHISDIQYKRLEYTTNTELEYTTNTEQITETSLGKQRVDILTYDYSFVFSLKYKNNEYQMEFKHPSHQMQLDWFIEFEHYIAMLVLDDELETKCGKTERKTKI